MRSRIYIKKERKEKSGLAAAVRWKATPYLQGVRGFIYAVKDSRVSSKIDLIYVFSLLATDQIKVSSSSVSLPVFFSVITIPSAFPQAWKPTRINANVIYSIACFFFFLTNYMMSMQHWHFEFQCPRWISSQVEFHRIYSNSLPCFLLRKSCKREQGGEEEGSWFGSSLYLLKTLTRKNKMMKNHTRCCFVPR